MTLSDQLKAASAETLSEVLREAECYLSAQLASGLAAAQRAIAFVGLLAAATIVIAGAGPALGWVCMGLAAVFVVAMYFGILTARPVPFEFAGNDPAHWVGDIVDGVPYGTSLAQQAAHYSDMIRDNNRQLQANARMMTLAIWIVWGGLVVGGIAAVLVLALAP